MKKLESIVEFMMSQGLSCDSDWSTETDATNHAVIIVGICVFHRFLTQTNSMNCGTKRNRLVQTNRYLFIPNLCHNNLLIKDLFQSFILTVNLHITLPEIITNSHAHSIISKRSPSIAHCSCYFFTYSV